MRSLDKIHFDETDSKRMLEKIIAAKHDKKKDGTANIVKKELKAGKCVLLRRYHCYYANKSFLYSLDTLTTIEDGLKSALIETYEDSPAAISNLRRKYRETDIWCPYCSVGRISQLDHYMPKSKFPEFALLDLNLIPSCSDCNNYKLEEWNPSEYVIFNPFIHKLPDIQILKAELTAYGDGVPIVRFYIDETTMADKSIVQLIKSHCEKLKLLTDNSGIYIVKAVEYLGEELRNLKKTYERNLKRMGKAEAIESICNMVQDQFDTNIEQNGINHWKSAVLEALVELKEKITDIML